MPRKPRYAPAGVCAHVVNRGNDRKQIFFADDDYDLFLELMIAGKRRAAVRVFGFCLMPNHFHAVIRPEENGALSTFMHWVTGNYATEWRARTATRGLGHVFQRRFWSDPARDDLHFLAQLRYVEANPMRAALVSRPEEWRWSSYARRAQPTDALVDPLPLALPTNWRELVTTPQSAVELETLRQPKSLGRPIEAEGT